MKTSFLCVLSRLENLRGLRKLSQILVECNSALLWLRLCRVVFFACNRGNAFGSEWPVPAAVRSGRAVEAFKK